MPLFLPPFLVLVEPITCLLLAPADALRRRVPVLFLAENSITLSERAPSSSVYEWQSMGASKNAADTSNCMCVCVCVWVCICIRGSVNVKWVTHHCPQRYQHALLPSLRWEKLPWHQLTSVFYLCHNDQRPCRKKACSSYLQGWPWGNLLVDQLRDLDGHHGPCCQMKV